MLSSYFVVRLLLINAKQKVEMKNMFGFVSYQLLKGFEIYIKLNMN